MPEASTPCATCTHPAADHDPQNVGDGCHGCPFWECQQFVELPRYDPAADHDPLPGLRIKVGGTGRG